MARQKCSAKDGGGRRPPGTIVNAGGLLGGRWLERVLTAVIVVGSLAATGCNRTLDNLATVYPIASGAIELRWNHDPTGVSKVRYELDGAVAGVGTDATRLFAFTVDTRTLPNGARTVRATALDSENQTLRAVTSTIMVENQ